MPRGYDIGESSSFGSGQFLPPAKRKPNLGAVAQGNAARPMSTVAAPPPANTLVSSGAGPGSTFPPSAPAQSVSVTASSIANNTTSASTGGTFSPFNAGANPAARTNVATQSQQAQATQAAVAAQTGTTASDPFSAAAQAAVAQALAAQQAAAAAQATQNPGGDASAAPYAGGQPTSPVSSSSGLTPTTLLVIGAVAVGALFLLTRGRGAVNQNAPILAGLDDDEPDDDDDED